MAAKIIVYADYVCPFCLLAEKALRQAIAGRYRRYTKTEPSSLLTHPLLQFMQHFHKVLTANVPYAISNRGSCCSISKAMNYCCNRLW